MEPSPGGVLSPSVPTSAQRKRGRPRDPEADERILTAASSLILLRGYESMTVDEVAAHAGVGKATVYRRWARKEDLAVAAMERLYRDEMPPPDTGSLRGDLTAGFAAVLAFVNSPVGSGYIRTTIRESMRDVRIAALYRSAGELAEKGAREMLARALERGELRPDAHLDAAVGFLGGLVAARAITAQPMPAEDELDALVDFVLLGISATPPAAGTGARKS